MIIYFLRKLYDVKINIILLFVFARIWTYEEIKVIFFLTGFIFNILIDTNRCYFL